MKYFFLFLLITIQACTTPKPAPVAEKKPDPFAELKGCFLLFNVKTQAFEKQLGTSCEERLPACSSFKVPLAVMAFDSGVLKNENQILKWDKKKRGMGPWNMDHNAKTWMRDSVVWFSQKLTPKIGPKKFQKYLKDFKYGNEDFSTGITQAWLNSPADPRGGLKINAFEQVEFMNKLWTNKLPVSQRAMDLTRQITFLESTPNGFVFSGKTGSNFYDVEKKIQLGWFISHIQKGDQEYIAVTNLSDLKPIETTLFGGFRAKEITKAQLAEAGLW